MKLFGVFGDSLKAKAPRQEGEANRALATLSAERVFEKHCQDKELQASIAAYNDLLLASQTTKRASVLDDRRHLAAYKQQALDRLATLGVTLEFVPTRFNKREDRSFEAFAALFSNSGS